MTSASFKKSLADYWPTLKAKRFKPWENETMKQQRVYIVSIGGDAVLRKFRSMRKCYAYLLWYSDRIRAHYNYKILSGTGRVLEEDTL
jgi:hypothetical protein